VFAVRVGCHYFPQGLQLPPQQAGCYQFCCLVNSGTMGVNSLPKTVTRQRRDCDLNPCSSERACNLRLKFLGCIECMRCSQFLPMFAASLCQSVMRLISASLCKNSGRDQDMFGMKTHEAYGTLCWERL